MAPSLLTRLGTAKAPSNGVIQSRVPAKNLPKRLGPLLGSVTIISEHEASVLRRRRHEYLIYIYSFFFGGMNIGILFFFASGGT